MGQSLNSKTNLTTQYYIFQKKIQNYLIYPEGKIDEYIIQKGYLIHPDWVENFRNEINYKELIQYLDPIFYKQKEDKKIDTTGIISPDRINKYQFLILAQIVEPELAKIDINSIIVKGANDFFKLKDNFFSLENLKGFINDNIYKCFEKINKNVKTIIKMEKIKYIFKKGMILILNDIDNSINGLDKLIKIILFDKENKNKLINIKFTFNYKEKYNEYIKFFEKNNSEEITKYLNSIEILKKNYYEHNDMNKILFTVTNESKQVNNKYFNNLVRTESFSGINNIKKKLSDKNVNSINDEDEDEDENEIKKSTTMGEEFNKLIEDQKIITVTFVGECNGIIMSMPCKGNVPFKKYEEKLFQKFPDYRDTDVTFLVNGNTINRGTTLDDNKIKDNDIIVLIKL